MGVHAFSVSRKNNKFKLPVNKEVSKLKVKRVIYDGEDLEKGNCFKLLINNFVGGIYHYPDGKQEEYTVMFFIDGGPDEWTSDSDTKWDWEGEEPKDISDIVVDCTIDGKKAKDVKLVIELELVFA